MGLRSGVATLLDWTGKVAKQPPFWAAATVLLATRGSAGRRAAARGAVGYGATALVANLVLKPLVHRRRPRGSAKGIPPLTSSFPSGHAASDTAFAYGAYRELPALAVPMLLLTTASHWSLVRTRSHYLSDILAGDLLGLAVAAALARGWPPAPETEGFDG